MHRYPLKIRWFETPRFETPTRGFYPFQILHAKADLLCLSGQLPQARGIHEKNILTAEASGQLALAAESRIKLTKILFSMGEMEAAMKLAEQAGEIYDQIDDQSSLVSVGVVMGILYTNLGDFPAALEHFNLSLEKAVKTRDIFNQGNIYNGLGNVYLCQGDYPKALEYFQKKLASATELNDRPGTGLVLGSIGNMYAMTGQHELALDYYRQTLSIAKEIGDRVFAAHAIGSMGTVYRDTGNFQSALDCFRQQLDETRKLGSVKDQAVAMASIADVYGDMNQPLKALDYFDQALTVFRRMGLKYHLCGILLDKAKVCFAIRDFAQAKALASETLDLSQEINRPDTLESARDFLNKLGDHRPG